eukprot:TRINITY_DN5750_c0_g1_i1.p1 TRINITY_DN5750_c0_g1~~TRINITY_DN5750_c0_g1_i1.p1  ORF type:complete len:1754 (+),score=443.48 TRINITY_DN5750_c0_g1_i1:220-5481(+)
MSNASRGESSILPVLCYVGPKGRQKLQNGREFDFSSVEAAIREAVIPQFQVTYIDVDLVARLFGGQPSKEKADLDSCIRNCDVLLYDLTGICTEYCKPAPPMSLAYYIGLRIPKSNDGQLIGQRPCPLSYKLFERLFRPPLEHLEFVREEFKKSATLYEKWAPVTVLKGDTPGSKWRICNVTTADTDCWNISDEDLWANYTLLEDEIPPEMLSGEDNGVQICDLLQKHFQGDEKQLASEISWSHFQLTLKFERERLGVDHNWRVALPRNIVVAMPLTQKLLQFCTANLQASRPSLANRLVWQHKPVTKANVYYRQETWGGEGAQPFKIGDFIVADVVPMQENTWPEGVQQKDIMIMNERYAWKRLKMDEGGGRITRTMSDSIFSRTYRNLASGALALTKASSLNFPNATLVRTFTGLSEFGDDETPRGLMGDKEETEETTEDMLQQSQRVQIALQGVEMAHEKGHPLASYAREFIKYDLTQGEALHEASDARDRLVEALRPLLEEAENMDGMVALREMFKTKIQSAARISIKSHARHELDSVRGEIWAKAKGDRQLVLQLIRAYVGHDEPQQAVDLMDQSVTLQQIGMGDFRIEILVEGAQALKKLGSEDQLKRATEILDSCVELLPSDETFGVLGGIHKKLSSLYESKGDLIRKRTHFLRSSDAYRKGARAGPENFYCGINWAMLLREQIQNESDEHMRRTLQQRFQELIPRVCVALGKVGALQPTLSEKGLEQDYWRVATAVELAAQSQEWAMGKQAMMVLFSIQQEMPADMDWMLRSTFTQQQNVLADLKKDHIAVDPVFEWWVLFYCQTFEKGLEKRTTFHVLHQENNDPATFTIQNQHLTHTRIGQSKKVSDQVQTVPFGEFGGVENSKDGRFIRLSFVKGKFETKMIQVLFPNTKLCRRFHELWVDAKRASKANLSRLKKPTRMSEDDASLEGSSAESEVQEVQIDENSVKVTAKQKKVLGEGTYAHVYQTTNLKTGKQIAVKVLKSKMFIGPSANFDWSAVAKEVRLMSTFQHENIVRYLGCQKGARDFFIFMEHLVGGSLQDLLRNKGGLDDRTIAMYTRDILSALTYLHAHEIIHRDVRAANVLLDEHLRVAKLADFGTSLKSRAKDDSRKPNTANEVSAAEMAIIGGKHGTLLGFTPAFVPPEVVMRGQVDTGVDVWALGCTVIQMVISRPNHCAEDPWEQAGEDQLPLHEDLDIRMMQDSNLHKPEGEPCWLCALERGKHPPVPSEMSPSGQLFLEQCLNGDPDERASVSQLMEAPYISSRGGVHVIDEVNQVSHEERGIKRSVSGELECDGLRISQTCDKLLEDCQVKHNEAFIIYSQATIAHNYEHFERALGLNHHLLFDVGANPSLELLQELAKLGVHAKLSCTNHLSLVTTAGFNQAGCMIDGTANMKPSAMQEAISDHTAFKVHNLLDLTRLKEATESNQTRTAVKLLLPSQTGRMPGHWFQQDLEDLLQEALKCDLFEVEGLHCEVFDLDDTAQALQRELELIADQSGKPHDRLLTVCLSGLDDGGWENRDCIDFTNKLSQTAQVFLEISHDLLANTALMIDRVLDTHTATNNITVQEGVFHPDVQLHAIHSHPAGSPGESLPQPRPRSFLEIEFQVTSFSKHATTSPQCSGFAALPHKGEQVAFMLRKLSSGGARPPSVQQFMVNKLTKAVEPMQKVRLELHNNHIYTAATSRFSVMKSISCPDLMRQSSDLDCRMSMRESMRESEQYMLNPSRAESWPRSGSPVQDPMRNHTCQ